MARKYELLSEMYDKTTKTMTNHVVWRHFLESACRNYRLRFDEQLLVFAQRPDATAVLEIERWNNREQTKGTIVFLAFLIMAGECNLFTATDGIFISTVMFSANILNFELIFAKCLLIFSLCSYNKVKISFAKKGYYEKSQRLCLDVGYRAGDNHPARMDGMAELEGIRAYRQLRQINHHARRRILA